MPRAGTYKRSPKAKVRWHVQQTPDGWLVKNRTTGVPLCGYWSTEAIALKNGRSYFQTEPSTPEEPAETPSETSGASSNLGTAQDGGVPGGTVPTGSATTIVDLPPPVPRVERVEETVDVGAGGEAMEGRDPPVAPRKPLYTPDEACEAVRSVFRGTRIARPKKH